MTDAVVAGSETWPAGTAVVEGLTSDVAAEIAAGAGADVLAVDTRPRGAGLRLRSPRIGLYEPWVANMDAGWTRFLLERFAFEYEVLRDGDIRKGELGDLYDVVILPSASARSLREGHAAGSMPARYTGGLARTGIEALRDFVRSGGTLVALDAATALPIVDLGLSIGLPLAQLERSDFYCPGALLRIDIDPSHPLTWGMPESATAFFVNSTAFEVIEGDAATVPVRYAGDHLLESGWILGPEHLQGQAAVVETPMGTGRVVLLGFRTQFRAQPHETFKLLFNALLSSAASPVTLQ